MKKGFTLVELLAVIVILAIIAIITIPMISNVIEKSKLGAMEDSAYGLIEAANYYYAEHMNEMSSNKIFVIENGVGTSEEKLNYKGKIEGNAKVLLASNGKVALCLTNGKSYAKKEITDSKVVMNTVSSDTTCEINGLESDSDITIDISGGNSSYYDKVEIDDKLNDIRNDLSDLSSIVSSNKAAIDNLNDSLNIRYNPKTDAIEIFYNNEWIECTPAHIQSYPLLKDGKLDSDFAKWGETSSNIPSASFTNGLINIIFNNSDTANHRWGYVALTKEINFADYKELTIHFQSINIDGIPPVVQIYFKNGITSSSSSIGDSYYIANNATINVSDYTINIDVSNIKTSGFIVFGARIRSATNKKMIIDEIILK